MKTTRSRSGRLIVLVIVVMGAGLGLAGLLLRERRGLSLPLQPGSIVVVTCETTARQAVTLERDPADPSSPNRTTFTAAVASSSELVANLGSLWTGKMPRVNGLVRDGDALRRDVPTLAEIAAEQGFATAAFAVFDAEALQRSGLSRGFGKVVASTQESDADRAEQAAQWLVERGREPSLAWLHLKSDAALSDFRGSLEARGVLDHAALLVTRPLATSGADGPNTLPRGGHVGLELQLPVPLLPRRVDPDPVSLIDVVASLVEVFGVRAPDGIGTPWLLHPEARAPNVVLSTRPLRGAFADADEVWLVAAKVSYVNAPTRDVGGGIDEYSEGGPWFSDSDQGTRVVESGDEKSAALRKVIGERFGYRFEEVAFSDVLKSESGRVAAEGNLDPREGAPARVLVARSTFRIPAK